MKFLVRGAGLGDTVALLPVLEEWRRQNPDEIFECSDRWQDEVFLGHPALEQGTLHTRSIWVFNAMAPPVYPGNMSEFYASQQELKLYDPTPRMYISGEEQLQAQESIYKQPPALPSNLLIAVDPWAGWPTRRWPWRGFENLVSILEADGFAVMEVGAKSDRTSDNSDAPERLPASKNFYDQLSVRETAAVLSYCDLYIGNDSGLAHVAAAVGIPQVVIYGVVPWYQRAYWNTTPVISRLRCGGGCGVTCGESVSETSSCLGAITVGEVYRRFKLAVDRFLKDR